MARNRAETFLTPYTTLERLASFPIERPRRALWCAAGLLLLAGLGFLRLELVSDIAQVIRTPAAEALERAARVFGFQDEAYILIETGPPPATEGLERNRAQRAQALREGARELERELLASGQFQGASHELALSEAAFVDKLLLPFGLLYTPREDLAQLDSLLSAEGLRTRLERQLEQLGLPGLGLHEEWIERDPLELRRPLLARLGTLRGNFKLAPGTQDFLSADGCALLVTATPRAKASSASGARETVRAIEQAMARVLGDPRRQGLRMSSTGAHFLAEESERVIRHDLILSLSGSLLLTALLLALSLRIPLLRVPLLCLPTLWGLVVGAGLFVAYRPQLASLSLGCSAILVGLGVDFTIHMVVAAKEAQSRFASTAEALTAAARSTRGRLSLAAATSMAAFLAFQTSHQSFLRDMGLLTVFGLIACLVGAFLVLCPLLLGMLPELQTRGEAPHLARATLAVARFALRHRRAVLGVTGVVTLAAGTIVYASPPELEQDLRNIHARDSAPLATQARIARVFGGSNEPLLLLLEEPSPEALSAACQRLDAPLRKLCDTGWLAARSSLAALLPARDDQAACLALLARKDPAALRVQLLSALETVGFEPEVFSAYAMGFERALARTQPLDIQALEEAGLHGLLRPFVRAAAAPARGRTHGLIVLHPAQELWSAARRNELLARVERALDESGVDAAVTGLLPVASETAGEIGSDFARVSGLTLVAVVAVILLRFRGLRATLVCLLPTALGSLLTAAIFALSGWRMNLMNLGVLPMVFAIGIDDGIHLVAHAQKQGRAALEAVFQSTGTAVVLTSLTTMITFGSLALSSNRGLASVGILSFLGVGACLLTSIVVLPAALATWFGVHDSKADQTGAGA